MNNLNHKDQLSEERGSKQLFNGVPNGYRREYKQQHETRELEPFTKEQPVYLNSRLKLRTVELGGHI